LLPNEYKNRIFEYLGDALRTLDCKSLQIGGMNNHIHITSRARTPFQGCIHLSMQTQSCAALALGYLPKPHSGVYFKIRC
jgi:hypothetical protein